MRDESGHFAKGNKFAFKWTEEEAFDFMESVLEVALDEEDPVYHISEAVIRLGKYPTSIYHILSKYGGEGTVFDALKNNINEAILARVNRGALLNKLVPAPAIWRMKQLGEKDTSHQHVDHTSKGQAFNPMDIIHGIKGDSKED